jgi:hypothetical protein
MQPVAYKNQTKQKINNVLNNLFTAMLWLTLLVVFAGAFAWNWDGFWQTDIKQLKSAQLRYFPAKVNEENLKLSRVLDNNKVIAGFENKLVEAEADVETERQRASNSLMQLKALVAEQHTKCQYYRTSLRIIDNLTRKISPEDLQALVKCTNQECEQIIKSTPYALSLCG